MATPNEELMKKLEAFMIQQTQITNELKTAVEGIQNKQAALEEGLLSKDPNSAEKQEDYEESVDEEIEMERPEGRPDLGRGRGRGVTFGSHLGSNYTAAAVVGRGKGPMGSQPAGLGRGSGKNTEFWRMGGPQPFKHHWDPLRFEGPSRREQEQPRLWDDSEETGHRGHRVPRFAKMDFPTYDGKSNPAEWLQRCEDFFEEQQTPPEAWVRQATFSLQGRASGWYHNLRRMKTRLSWSEFSDECRIRFGPPLSMNPLGELTRLRQEGTVDDYCDNFESLLCRTTGVTPEQSIWHFCAGLSNAIRYEVEYARPNTLYFAMNLARQIEFKLAEERRPRSFGPPMHSKPNPRTQQRENPDESAPRNPTWKRLTSAEMADRRAKGLCFNCDELFSVGHQCAKLFCIMMADEDEETQETMETTEEEIPRL